MCKLLSLAAILGCVLLFRVARDPHADDSKSKKAVDLDKVTVTASVVSLKKLTADAEIIFVGRVDKVFQGKQEIESGEKRAIIPIQGVTFSVIEALKGELKNGQGYTVTQYARTASPVKEGEEVLWYLPKPSKHGLVAPIGFYSGHFSVQSDKKNGKTAVNLKANDGLWPANEPILSGPERVDGKLFASILSKRAEGERYKELMLLANEPYTARELPLELILAVTETYLRMK